METQEHPEKSAPTFTPTDDIAKPFGQFSGVGAEFADDIPYEDWSQLGRLLSSLDYGRATQPSADRVEGGNGSRDAIIATAGILSSSGRTRADSERPFDRTPPPRLARLIELVRCLPPHNSFPFRLLHPLIVGIEQHEWPINFEKGVILNAEFRKIFNELFDKSSKDIADDKRSGLNGWGLLTVFSCAFWHSRDFTDYAKDLTGDYWRLILKKDYEAFNKLDFEAQDRFEMENDDVSDLRFWTTIVGGEEIDLNRNFITLDRAFRFGLPRTLTDYLIGDNPLACGARMADLYESFYILHDIAYMACHGYKEATLLDRDDSSLLIGEDGTVQMHRSLFWDIARTEPIRAVQIRVCKLHNCRRIFWAKAKNQVCCTARCANLYEKHKKRYPTAEAQAAYRERLDRRRQRQLKRRPKPA